MNKIKDFMELERACGFETGDQTAAFLGVTADRIDELRDMIDFWLTREARVLVELMRDGG